MLNRRPFEDVRFVQNQEPRVPCMLLLDTTRFMQGSSIDELNAAIAQFKRDVMHDPIMARRIDLAVVSFGRTVTVEQEFAPLGRVNLRELPADGEVPPATAMRETVEVLNRQKAIYRQNGVAYDRPEIYLISSGHPAERYAELVEQIKEGQKQNQFAFYTFAVRDSNLDALKKLSLRGEPRLLQGFSFRELFYGPCNVQPSPSSSAADDCVETVPTAGRWASLAASVRGTSHVQTGAPCQDHHRVVDHRANGKEHLIVACSDGAGSASLAEFGSRTACDVVVEQVREFLDSGQSLAAVDRAVAMGWFGAAHARLNLEAHIHGVDVRQFSSTLMLAVVGDDRSLFVQIGDGGMVTLDSTDGGSLRPVFWPQNREYANMTYFIVDPRFEEWAQFENRDGSPDGVAAFTDGMQLLALDYADRSAHQPFFAPMIRQLSRTANASDLATHFREFLDSDSVNERTDDDKTLVLAIKRAKPARKRAVQPQTFRVERV